MANIQTRLPLTMPAAGTTLTVPLGETYDRIILTPATASITLAASLIVTTSGAAVEGMELVFLYKGGVTSDVLGGKKVTIIGVDLTDAQALLEMKIEAYYNGAAWEVRFYTDLSTSAVKFNGAELVPLSVTTGILASKAVTTAKIADLSTEGSIFLATTAGLMGQLNASGDKKVLMGNGSTLTSVALTGPILYSNLGVGTIQDGVIETRHLGFGVDAPLTGNLTIAAADVLLLNSTPLQLVPTPGAGLGIEFISGTISIDSGSSPYITNLNIQILCNGAAETQVENNDILPSTILRNLKLIPNQSVTAAQTQIVANTALMIQVESGNPADGTGNIRINFLYRIVPVYG